MDLREALTERQRALGWTDSQMAEALGVGRTMWHAVKSGRSPMGVKVLRGVVRAFPDLQGYVLTYLQGSEPQPDPPGCAFLLRRSA